MNLLKTKFYPVDIERKIIYIDPMKRERDVAHKYGRGENICIGLTGARLMEKKCYLSYKQELVSEVQAV